MTSDKKSFFEKLLEYLLFVLLCAIVLLVLIQVCSRYVIQLPFIGIEELARLVFVWACLLGAALGTIRGRHVRIEFLVRVLPAGMTTFFALLSSVIILMVSAVMVTHGTYFVINRWSFPDYSTALLYPRSLFYLPVPLSGAIMFIYTAKHTITKLKNLFLTTKASSE
jgi:TRAP-type C4-dicarboxylate transport system permease small subunit